MSRIGVGLMAAALLVYLAVSVWLAVMFFAVGTPVSIGMGVALIVLAPIGAWALIREVQFGFAADRLGRALDAEGGMPEAESELTPSGRIARADADPLIARYAGRRMPHRRTGVRGTASAWFRMRRGAARTPAPASARRFASLAAERTQASVASSVISMPASA